MRAVAAAALLPLAAALSGGIDDCPFRKALSDQETTVRGCTCTSDCGATVDFDQSIWDWCYTGDDCGSAAPSRLGKYYDYCTYPPDQSYESQTAKQKMNLLWDKITGDPSGGQYPAGASVAGIFVESVKTSFEANSDVMPAGRTKYIHSVGSVCQAKFQATPGSPYTGAFSGASQVLIRFSSAKDLDQTTPSMTPGFGIKFLRDGMQSANFVAMPSLDGQSSFNFFEKNFTNHPAFPSGFALQLIARKFWQASNCPLQVGLWRAASWTEDGQPVEKPVFPYLIVFKPTGQVNFPSSPYPRSTLNEQFNGIKAGTNLFEVYGHPSPGAPAERMGNLIITSDGCTTSTFGDNSLFFKHDYKEDDFARRPDWLATVQAGDVKSICGMPTVSGTAPNPEPTNG